MSNSTLRKQLQKQIDKLPDEIVEEIADFTLFVMKRRAIFPDYDEWNDRQWQEFVLEQFFREDDEVEYSLDDAEEIYDS